MMRPLGVGGRACLAVVVAMMLGACGDTSAGTEDADAVGSDTATSDVMADTASADTGVGDSGGSDLVEDVGDAPDVPGDTIEADATVADADDGGDAPDTGAFGCACDVTSLCDEGCACDIACSLVPGPAPLGAAMTLYERSEVVAFHPSSPLGERDHLYVADDATPAPDGPAVPLGELADGSIAAQPDAVALAADVDGDGRDEVVLATTTELNVGDWDGALGVRSVFTYPEATFIDLAAGDLDQDGVDEIVLSHQDDGGAIAIVVFDVGETGPASVVAEGSASGATRHALAVGPASLGEAPSVWLLHAADGLIGGPEDLTLRRLALQDDALVMVGEAQDLGYECNIPVTDTRFGMSLVHTNLDGDSALESAYALYCPTGALHVAVFDPGAILLERLQLGTTEAQPGQLADLLPSRPLLRRLRVGDGARLLLGNTVDAGVGTPSGPRGRVRVLRLTDDLDVIATLDLSQEDTDPETSDEASALTSLAVADLDRDGDDEVVAGSARVRLTPIDENSDSCVSGCTAAELGVVVEVLEPDLDGSVVLVDTRTTPQEGLGVGPLVLAGDLDGDSVRVRATGAIYRHTGPPFVNAVLAGPPMWLDRAGVTHTYDSSTSFGTTESTGTTDTRTLNATASASVSAGPDFGVVSFSAGVEATYSESSSASYAKETSFGTETSVGAGADIVLYRLVPYASHEYIVVADPDEALVGTKITIDVPGDMVETVRTVEQFRAELGDDALPGDLLAHTLGDPTSYMASADCTQSALAQRIGSGSVSAVAVSPTLLDVGSAPTGGRTQTITVATQTGSESEVSLGVTLKVGVDLGGTELEASAGLGSSYTHETTIGHELTYTGAVGYLSAGYGGDTAYTWGLCVFHYSDPDLGAFPVVTYVVE